MARSRLAKIGTIYSRTSGLLRAGAMKEEDTPLWFDVYEAFPPKDEPRYDRPESKMPIREILYKEDVIRAKYQKDHPNLPIINMENKSYKTQTQKFIAAYQQLQMDYIEDSELYERAVLSLETDHNRRKAVEMQKPETTTTEEGGEKPEKINLNIKDIF